MVPYKVSLQWCKFDVPYGCPSMEKGAVMNCPLCRLYVTVSQRVPFPVEKMGCSADAVHDCGGCLWSVCCWMAGLQPHLA